MSSDLSTTTDHVRHRAALRCARRPRRWHYLLGMLFAWLMVFHAQALGQSVESENFEGPDAILKVGNSDARYRLWEHARTRDTSHLDGGSEKIRFQAGNGSYLYFGYSIAPATVIAELQGRVWVNSNRPGAQLLFRAVLPRTRNPQTGEPVTTLLSGSSYTQTGKWQQLEITDLPEQLAAHVRMLRAQFGPKVDPREAYIDRVVLNVYGGQGETNIWVDDLEVRGIVGRTDDTQPAQGDQAGPAASQLELLPPVENDRRREVKLSGEAILVGDRTFLPRIVQHRGEPLTQLRQLGFNVVRLAEPATPDLLLLARQLDLWLIAPPPARETLQREGINGNYAPVLAWDLGDQLAKEEIESTRAWADLIAQKDAKTGRPILGNPQTELRTYSRILNVLLVGRDPLASSLSLTDYSLWCAERPQLARPGTPVWMRIQTDLDAGIHDQHLAFTNHAVAGPSIDDQQIRMLVHAALAAGARGLLFDSHTPLSGSSAAAQQRRLALEMVNHELNLIEPWASSTFVTRVESLDKNVSAVVLQNERARLMLPLRTGQYDQFVPGQAFNGSLAFVIPGVPESNDAYELTPAGLRPLRHKRVAGGIRIQMDQYSDLSMVLLTGDPLVVSSLTRRLSETQKRAAELQCQLAQGKYQRVLEVERRLTAVTRGAITADPRLETAKGLLEQGQRSLRIGDAQNAFLQARAAAGVLGSLEHDRYVQAVQTWPSTVSSPLAASYTTLPEHFELTESLRTSQAQANLMPAGAFENLQEMLRAGWRHSQYSLPGIASTVELSTEAPSSGQTSLRLQVAPTETSTPIAPLETAPVWITSPPVHVEAGQLVRIHGWVRVPRTIQGSVDGLLIVDSLAGPALAERVKQTAGWQEFTLYRSASQSQQLEITFALAGVGEAYLDAVTVEVIQRPAAPQPQSTAWFTAPAYRR